MRFKLKSEKVEFLWKEENRVLSKRFLLLEHAVVLIFLDYSGERYLVKTNIKPHSNNISSYTEGTKGPEHK